MVPELKKKVQVFPSGGKKFRFGGGKVLPSIKLVKFPGRLAGRDVMFSSHVVQSNIPLLWSRPAMARAGTVLDLPKDRAKILGVWVDLELTDVGHYALDIMPPDMVVTEQCLVTLPTDVKEKEATLRKLHRQFGHPRQEVTVGLLRKVNCADNEVKKMEASIHESYATCKRFSPTPPRLVVSLPQASDLGEVLTLDLKEEPQAEEVQPAAGEHGVQAEVRQQEEGHPEQQAEVPGQQADVPVQKADVPVQQDDVPVQQDDVPVQQDDVPVQQDDVQVQQVWGGRTEGVARHGSVEEIDEAEPASLPGNFTSLMEGSTLPPPKRNFLPPLGNTCTFFFSSGTKLAW